MKTNKMKTPTPTTSHTAPGSLAQLSALAQQLAAQGKSGEAAAAIEQIFAGDAPQDEGSARLLDEARQSYFACQEELARQNRLAAAQVAAELQAETEKLADYPIRVTFEDDADLPDGGGQVGLGTRPRPASGGVPARTRGTPAIRAGRALLRIQTETEACRAGKSRFPTVSRQQIDDLLFLFDPYGGSASLAGKGSG